MTVCLTLSNEISNDNWKTSIPLINGLGTEGIGSVFQYHILMNFFSDFIGIDFTFPGSENLSHYSYTKYSAEEFHKSIDDFFNFPNLDNNWDEVYMITELNEDFFRLIDENRTSNKRILLNLYRCHLHILNFCSKNLHEIFIKDRIDKIRNNLVFTGEKYFDDDINISLHLRTPNPNDIAAEIVSPLRELYTKEKDFHRYKNLIDYLKEQSKGRKVTFHIHSQGFKYNFNEFLDLIDNDFDVQLHIDDNPLSDLYHMANSSLLIMANSSFSWIASFLNSNQIIVRDNWSLFVHSNSIRANYDYKLL